jgi:putative membrane protein
VAASIVRRADVKGFILAVAAGAIAFLLLVQILPADMIALEGDLVPQQLAVALLVGVVNAVIKPIVKLLTLPISLLTMGLAGFIINAALLLGTALVVDQVSSIQFTIGGWPEAAFGLDVIVGAVVASVLLSLITAVVGLVVRD